MKSTSLFIIYPYCRFCKLFEKKTWRTQKIVSKVIEVIRTQLFFSLVIKKLKTKKLLLDELPFLIKQLRKSLELDENSIKYRWKFDFYQKSRWMFKYVASQEYLIGSIKKVDWKHQFIPLCTSQICRNMSLLIHWCSNMWAFAQ